MRKWAGAWLLALLIALLAAIDAFAAGTVLTVKTPATIPKAGEEFTVTVEISGNPGFHSLDMTLAYDKTEASCEEVGLGSVTKGALSASNPNASGGAKLALAGVNGFLGDGTVMICVFRSLTGGDPGVRLTEQQLSDADGKLISCTVTSETAAEPEPEKPQPVTTTPAAPTKPETPGNPAQPGTPATPETPEQQGGETAETATFTDVSPDFWGAKWIATAAQRGIFKGNPDGTFRPNDPIRRGDFVLTLYRMAGEPEVTGTAPFADVDPNVYYAKAVAWAYEKGFVNGKGSGFAPNDSLTRQEAMKILFAVSGGQSGMELMLTATYDEGFSDSGEIASWAKPAMYWAYYKEIVGGTSKTTLSPTMTVTRAQLAKILVEYQNKSDSER